MSDGWTGGVATIDSFVHAFQRAWGSVGLNSSDPLSLRGLFDERGIGKISLQEFCTGFQKIPKIVPDDRDDAGPGAVSSSSVKEQVGNAIN